MIGRASPQPPPMPRVYVENNFYPIENILHQIRDYQRQVNNTQCYLVRSKSELIRYLSTSKDHFSSSPTRTYSVFQGRQIKTSLPTTLSTNFSKKEFALINGKRLDFRWHFEPNDWKKKASEKQKKRLAKRLGNEIDDDKCVDEIRPV